MGNSHPGISSYQDEKPKDYRDEKPKDYRDEKPKDYTLKVQNFSWLKTAICKEENHRYESNIFNAIGYKWKLALYLCGDSKQINVRDHISLYLVTVEDDILSGNLELNVQFTFLIYDGIRDRYLTIQDGKIRRFHSMKREWGFEKLVSFSDFNDVSNGFLVNDCCAFGVDIVVMKFNQGKEELLYMVKQPKNHTFTWKVTDFFNLEDKLYESDLFQVENHKWRIFLYPRGISKDETGFLSLFLVMKNFKNSPLVFVEFEIAVLGRPGFHARRETFKRWFNGTDNWGLPKFISLKDLEKPKNGFLHDNNTLIVQVKINAISTRG